MAEKTSLEQQLVAFKGYTADPQGVAAAAKERAGISMIEGLKDIGAAWGRRKQKIDTQNEGYENNWESTRKKMDENLGSLDIDYWDKATQLAEEIKPIYDACPTGQEGNKCRQKEMMKLNQFINHTSEVKKTIGGYNELTKKIESGEISKSNYKDPRKIAILGSIDGNKSTIGGVNDTEIANLTEKMKSASAEEKTALRKKIETLKKSNPEEYGWDITYTDHSGNEVNERVTLKDLDDLIPKRDDDITNKMMNAKNTTKLDNSNYKEGEEGGHAFDENVARTNSQDAVNEENLVSYWHDDFGFGEPLNTRITDHPALVNMTYSDLGLDLKYDTEPKDGILSKKEMDKIGDIDMDKIINVLSDPTNPLHTEKIERLSLEIARDDFVNNLRKESEIDLWGDEYWNSEDLVYNEVTYDNLAAKQTAIKEHKSTPGPKETLPVFLKRGGVVGAAAKKNIFWDDGAKEWRVQEMSGDEMYNKYLESLKKTT